MITVTIGAEKLIHMAEQIAANITIIRDQDVIAEKLADHLQRFWDPRMREELVAYAGGHKNELSPVLLAAVDKLAA